MLGVADRLQLADAGEQVGVFGGAGEQLVASQNCCRFAPGAVRATA
jgi:hypothetical protein